MTTSKTLKEHALSKPEPSNEIDDRLVNVEIRVTELCNFITGTFKETGDLNRVFAETWSPDEFKKIRKAIKDIEEGNEILNDAPLGKASSSGVVKYTEKERDTPLKVFIVKDVHFDNFPSVRNLFEVSFPLSITAKIPMAIVIDAHNHTSRSFVRSAFMKYVDKEISKATLVNEHQAMLFKKALLDEDNVEVSWIGKK